MAIGGGEREREREGERERESVWGGEVAIPSIQGRLYSRLSQ